MTVRTTRLRGSLAALVTTAALAGMGLAFAQTANAAPTDSDLSVTVSSTTLSGNNAAKAMSVTVGNNGPATSSHWSVSLTVPSTVTDPTLVDVTRLYDTCSVTGYVVKCTGSDLAPGKQFSFGIEATPAVGGSQQWTATVTGTEHDPDQTNNAGTSTLTVIMPPSGDWGTSGKDLMAPGASRFYDDTFTCLSADGCDYVPGLTISDHATNGGSFNPGTNVVYLNGQTGIGTCTVTTSDVTCKVAATGHANKGDTIGSREIRYAVAPSAAPDVQVFARTVTVPSGWTGDDPSNNVFPIYTPPVAGAPMADLTLLGGVGGLVLVLAGAYALRRRSLASVA